MYPQLLQHSGLIPACDPGKGKKAKCICCEYMLGSIIAVTVTSHLGKVVAVAVRDALTGRCHYFNMQVQRVHISDTMKAGDRVKEGPVLSSEG